MRPLELHLRNFRSFRGDNHYFNFRGRGLIGIVGPIGSGKSTILDAISFALYSKTPRIGRNTSTLIHQREDHAQVKLRFEVEGEVWEAVRLIRRKGASQHALYRLPDDEPDSEPVEKVMMGGEVNSRIVELLGLDYEGFGRSVMLAQGQFAQFLSARPAERDKVLKGVFGYERVGLIREQARESLRTTESEIEKLEVRIEHVEEARARQEEREEELSATQQRLATLEEAQPRFQELDERISRSADQLRRVSERLDGLQEEGKNLPDLKKSQALLEAASGSQARKEEADRILAEADTRLREAEADTESEEFAWQRSRLEEATELGNRLKSNSDRIQSRRDELGDKADGLPDREAGIRAIELAVSSRGHRAQAARKWRSRPGSVRRSRFSPPMITPAGCKVWTKRSGFWSSFARERRELTKRWGEPPDKPKTLTRRNRPKRRPDPPKQRRTPSIGRRKPPSSMPNEIWLRQPLILKRYATRTWPEPYGKD